MEQRERSRTVQSVQTTLDVIEVLRERDGAGVTELADELGRSKGTIHGHLSTLLENEYVVRDEDTYRLSLRYLELGEEVKDRVGIYDVVRDELDDLAAETDEIAQFATEEHGWAVYVYKAAGENAVQTASSVGQREHMHCISLGKAILATLPRRRVTEIVDRHGLPPHTDATITSRDRLFEQLREVADRGYAFDHGENIEGLRCVATPVVVDGELVGAISVSGPSGRMQGEFFREELPRLVTRSANVIEINAKFS